MIGQRNERITSIPRLRWVRREVKRTPNTAEIIDVLQERVDVFVSGTMMGIEWNDVPITEESD